MEFTCSRCNKIKEYHVPDICIPCFFPSIFNEANKKRNRWKEAKRLAYCIIIVGIPYATIGLKFGFGIEFILLLSYLYGMYIPEITSWLTEKF